MTTGPTHAAKNDRRLHDVSLERGLRDGNIVQVAEDVDMRLADTIKHIMPVHFERGQGGHHHENRLDLGANGQSGPA